jgi:hypothetical protein
MNLSFIDERKTCHDFIVFDFSSNSGESFDPS